MRRIHAIALAVGLLLVAMAGPALADIPSPEPTPGGKVGRVAIVVAVIGAVIGGAVVAIVLLRAARRARAHEVGAGGVAAGKPSVAPGSAAQPNE